MSREKSNIEFKRININVPISMLFRIKNFADSLGVNMTSACIFLLNDGLNQNEALHPNCTLTPVNSKDNGNK